MTAKEMTTRIDFILSPSEYPRVTIFEGTRVKVRIDVHGLSCRDAKRLIANIVNLCPSVEYDVEVIHGFNHGAAIKDMLATDFSLPRVKANVPNPHNPGITTLSIF